MKIKFILRETGPTVCLQDSLAEVGKGWWFEIWRNERDCMISHGSLQFLKERMVDVSDNYRAFVCNTCGLISSVNPEKNIYKCGQCKNYIDFSEVRIPYACKLLIQELESMCIAPRIKVNA